MKRFLEITMKDGTVKKYPISKVTILQNGKPESKYFNVLMSEESEDVSMIWNKTAFGELGNIDGFKIVKEEQP